MALHKTSKYIHIGCDEVYQMGECDLCRLEMHETLFLKHVKNVASIIHERFYCIHFRIHNILLKLLLDTQN